MWGKTDRGPQGVTSWLPLHQHLADAAGVAGLLVDEWLSPQVISRIARDLPDGAADTRTLAVWLAAVHDVGKASPAFLIQDLHLADLATRHGRRVDPRLGGDPLRGVVNHALVGHVAVQDWLLDDLGFGRRGPARQLAAIVGSHHGVPPESHQLTTVRERGDLAGTGPWITARQEILGWAAELVGGVDALRRFADVSLSLPAQTLLTAVVIVADWIASNDHLFPLFPLHTADGALWTPDAAGDDRRLCEGWRRLGLPGAWRPAATSDVGVDDLLTARFGRMTGARPVQRAALDMARSPTAPGLMIVEAPMGEGKTEAALLAVEAIAARTGADGCFVALPTRATSDAMFTRVLTWVEALPRAGESVSVTLAHGTANLNDAFTGLSSSGRLQSVGTDTGGDVAIAHAWLRGRKKGVLAQMVVGTVDQVLFAGLKSRHLMLRHLGLAGKVVVIDEVHAYDVYMSQYLERVLHWLGAYAVPVILARTRDQHGRARVDQLLRAVLPLEVACQPQPHE